MNIRTRLDPRMRGTGPARRGSGHLGGGWRQYGTAFDHGPMCEDDGGCPRLAEARAEAAMAERQLLEFNHRLANVLQAVVALLARHRRSQSDPAARVELDAMASRLAAVASLHRQLFVPSRQAHVDLGAMLGELAAAIEGVTGLQCELDVEPVSVPGRVATHLATVVNELAWNAHKHAYRDGSGNTLRVGCRRDPAGHLRIWVADRGCGLPPAFDPEANAGFGLMIVRATAEAFGGELHVVSGEETRFTLLLPAACV